MDLFRNRSLLAATLGHFSVDLYSGMIPLILLIQKDALGLSYAQVGLVSTAFSLSGSVFQPLFGWLGDKRGLRLIAALGIACTAAGIGSMRLADSYTLLLLLAILGGLGSGAYHPQGAVLAAQTTSERRGATMSIFMLGGNTGFAFGPLIASISFALAGLYLPELLGVLGLVLAGILYYVLSKAPRPQRLKAAPGKSVAAAAISLIITVTLVIFLRTWVQTSVSTYVPQVFKSQGASTADAGNLLFFILLFVAIGGLVGGTLSDRVGRRRVLIVSTGLMGPALWFLLRSEGALTYLAGPLLGLAIGASGPVTIVMTQELIPRGLGFMSGVALGLNFVSGAIGVWLTGVLADQVGIVSAMNWIGVLPLGAAALAFLLPADTEGPSLRERIPWVLRLR